MDTVLLSGSSEDLHSLIDLLKTEFTTSCEILERIYDSIPRNAADISELKMRLGRLESCLMESELLRCHSRLRLWDRVKLMVRRRLEMRAQSGRKETDLKPQSDRFPTISRTYRSVSPRHRLASPIPMCPFDKGYYRMKQLMDELSAGSCLPNDTFSVVGFDLRDSHLEFLGRVTKYDLGSVKRLDLSSNNFSSSEVLCKFVKKSKCLSEVFLSHNKLGLDSVRALVQAASTRPDFRLMDLRHNVIDFNQLRHHLLLLLEKQPTDKIISFKHSLDKILIDKKTSCLALLHSLNPES